MSENTANDRLALKTPEASFLHVLEHEFDLSYREAREVVSAAREWWSGCGQRSGRHNYAEHVDDVLYRGH